MSSVAWGEQKEQDNMGKQSLTNKCSAKQNFTQTSHGQIHCTTQCVTLRTENISVRVLVLRVKFFPPLSFVPCSPRYAQYPQYLPKNPDL